MLLNAYSAYGGGLVEEAMGGMPGRPGGDDNSGGDDDPGTDAEPEDEEEPE